MSFIKNFGGSHTTLRIWHNLSNFILNGGGNFKVFKLNLFYISLGFIHSYNSKIKTSQLKQKHLNLTT